MVHFSKKILPVLFAKRTRWRPTWAGYLILLAFPLLILFMARHWIHDFLVLNAPAANAEISITEGWLPDSHIEEIKTRLAETEAEIYSAGQALEQGSALLEFKTYAEMTEKRFEALGFPPDRVIAAPSGKTFRHRTYYTAIAVRDKLIADKGKIPESINVYTEGVHARRSRLVYQKVFGDDTEVGVVALSPLDYDATQWWKVSAGAKNTLIEWIAFLHEWLLDSGRNS